MNVLIPNVKFDENQLNELAPLCRTSSIITIQQNTLLSIIFFIVFLLQNNTPNILRKGFRLKEKLIKNMYFLCICIFHEQNKCICNEE